jgi:hypothetical protein
MIGLSPLQPAARPALGLRALWCAWALIACAVAAPRARAQAEAEDPGYRQTVDDAVREFAAGHWEEARALFKRAHDVSPNARTLRGMGMAAFELRMYVQAMRELDASLHDPRKPLDAELRAQVEQLMAKSREFAGRVTLVLQPPEAKPLIDGKELQSEPDGSVLLDVGTHVISATANGYKSTNIRFNVEGGSDQAVRVALEPLLALQPMVPAIDAAHPPAQPPKPSEPPKTATPAVRHEQSLAPYAWVALASAGAFGIASGVFWIVGEGQYKDLNTSCAPGCSPQQIDGSGVKTSDLLTNVFLGAAAVSAVTSGVLFAIDAARSGEHDSLARRSEKGGATLALHPGPTGVSLRGTF